MAKENEGDFRRYFSDLELKDMRKYGEKGKQKYFEKRAKEETEWAQTYERNSGGEKLAEHHYKRAETYQSIAQQIKAQKEKHGVKEGGLVKKILTWPVKALVTTLGVMSEVSRRNERIERMAHLIIGTILIIIGVSLFSPKLTGNVISNSIAINSSIPILGILFLILGLFYLIKITTNSTVTTKKVYK